MQTQLVTVTQKGQITLPINFRNYLGVKPYSRVLLSISKDAVLVQKTEDIMDLAGFITVPKGKDALKAREYMAKHYKRK